MTFVDSHCHLNYKGLIEDQQTVLERARARGVGTMLNISTREREWDDIIATAEREPEVFATVREVSKRTTGMRHFDVQILGGMDRRHYRDCRNHRR